MIQSKKPKLYKYLMFTLTVLSTIVITILSFGLIDSIEDFFLKKYFFKNCDNIFHHAQQINSIIDYITLANILIFILFFLLFILFLTKHLRHLNMQNIFFTVTVLTLFNSVIIATLIYTKQFTLTSTINVCTYIKKLEMKIYENNNTTNQHYKDF